MRALATIFGIVLAAAGGVVAYRAMFGPTAAVVITNSGVREMPDYFRIATGIVLLIVGAAIAFTAARSKK
jgi:hypothetical protein